MTASTPTAVQNTPLAPIWVGTAIMVFFPVGLYLLWKHPVLGRSKAWWYAGIAWSVLYVVANLNHAGSSNTGAIGTNDASAPSASTLNEQEPIKRSFWGAKELAYKKRIDLCDNPHKYKDMEMRMEVLYNGGGLRSGGKLVSMPCRVFYGDGSFDMKFAIPSDVSKLRIEPGQYLMVTFIFSGSVESPSRVIAIDRQ